MANWNPASTRVLCHSSSALTGNPAIKTLFFLVSLSEVFEATSPATEMYNGWPLTRHLSTYQPNIKLIHASIKLKLINASIKMINASIKMINASIKLIDASTKQINVSIKISRKLMNASIKLATS